MKSLLMLSTTLISISIGFVLSDRLYDEERVILMQGDYYIVKDAEPSLHRDAYGQWDDPSHIVY